jgi:hypothetical protein
MKTEPKRLLLACIAFLAVFAACGEGNDVPGESATVDISSAGGEVSLPDGTTLKIPAAAVDGTLTVTLDQRDIPPAPPPYGQELGMAVHIDLQEVTLARPATLELPYDPARIPDGQGDDNVFVAYYDDAIGEWVPVGGILDPARGVVTVELTTASWWRSWSWLVDGVAQLIIAGFKLDLASVLDVFRAFDGCDESQSSVVIDESRNRDYLAACVEQSDLVRPRLRIINRRTFHVKVERLDGSATIDPASFGEPLARLQQRSFVADFSQAKPDEPLIVQAKVDWLHTTGHMFLDLLLVFPGLSQVISDDTAGLMLLELYRNRHVIAAAERLTAGDIDGFWPHFSRALGDGELVTRLFQLMADGVGTGSILHRLGLDNLLLVLKKLRIAAVGLQMVDAIRSASFGSGELLIYSNKPDLGAQADALSRALATKDVDSVMEVLSPGDVVVMDVVPPSHPQEFPVTVFREDLLNALSHSSPTYVGVSELSEWQGQTVQSIRTSGWHFGPGINLSRGLTERTRCPMDGQFIFELDTSVGWRFTTLAFIDPVYEAMQQVPWPLEGFAFRVRPGPDAFGGCTPSVQISVFAGLTRTTREAWCRYTSELREGRDGAFAELRAHGIDPATARITWVPEAPDEIIARGAAIPCD